MNERNKPPTVAAPRSVAIACQAAAAIRRLLPASCRPYRPQLNERRYVVAVCPAPPAVFCAALAWNGLPWGQGKMRRPAQSPSGARCRQPALGRPEQPGWSGWRLLAQPARRARDQPLPVARHGPRDYWRRCSNRHIPSPGSTPSRPGSARPSGRCRRSAEQQTTVFHSRHRIRLPSAFRRWRSLRRRFPNSSGPGAPAAAFIGTACSRKPAHPRVLAGSQSAATANPRNLGSSRLIRSLGLDRRTQIFERHRRPPQRTGG